MEAVDIVAPHNILSHLTYISTIIGKGGIENVKTVVTENASRFTNGNMIISQFVGELCLGPIRIDPCVNLHATLMALLDHPCQRIPIGLWCTTLHTGQKTTPRLELALV